MAGEKYIEVGGRLHSIATGNVLAGANEIIDDNKEGKKQSVINAETDAALEDRYTKEQTYSKSELNNMITTPNQEYVSVTATAQTTAVTDLLPTTGAADTIYRVGNWDGSQYDPSVYSEYAWNGSQYVHLSTKTQIGEVFDISAYHATGGTLATYADLSSALDSNNGGGVPQSLQKGGMSVKYVQSSDNKYVQYRLMSDEWSINTDDWAIADEGVYVENPEFVYVKTDKEGKILWAIKADGSIYYGAGVPQQVIDYIEEKIADISLDEYEDIVAFLSDYLGSDTTLKVMIDEINASISNLSNTKVDKEDGKSLIDSEYAFTKSSIENPEFLEVTTDSEDKVLEGIQKDGTKVIGGDLKVLGNMEVSGVSYRVIENPEYLAAWVDAEYKVIFGLKTDGKTYIEDADFLNDIKDNQEAIAEIKTTLATIGAKVDSLDIDALSSIIAVENPEYIGATTDSEGKILAGRTPDGAAFENVGFSTPKVSIDGHIIENIEDPEERLDVKTDNENKIISYRDKEGVLHEDVGIVTNNLNLSNDGMTEFQKQLKKNGFVATRNDYSEADLVHIPKPKMAFVNIICEQLPTSKEVEYEGYFEYSDTYGNYFKKPIEALSGQGRTSILFPKKNYGFDFADGSKIKFGDWVEQDSFHLKANYIDCFRGARLMIGYHMSAQIMNTYTYEKARPWRYLFANNTTINGATGKIADDLSNEALGVPDGFPFRLYHNGTYIGLYNLQLKKHRDNYQMGKSKAKNIHIDGEQYDNSLFNGSANIDWTLFEVRNPKGLKDINGKKYDGDNPKELSDTDALSAEVKGYIEDFSNKASAITTKQEFEEVIDVDYAIDYVLLMNFLMNLDVINNNTQWCTWDGKKWFPLNYDDDQCFGLTSLGNEIRTTVNQRPDDCILGVNFQTGTPLSLLYTLYKERMDLRYKELVDAGILTVKNVIDKLTEWCDNIGKAYYDEEFTLWPETPSYRESDSYPNYPQTGGLYDSIERVEKYMTVRKLFLDTYFNYN